MTYKQILPSVQHIASVYSLSPERTLELGMMIQEFVAVAPPKEEEDAPAPAVPECDGDLEWLKPKVTIEQWKTIETLSKTPGTPYSVLYACVYIFGFNLKNQKPVSYRLEHKQTVARWLESQITSNENAVFLYQNGLLAIPDDICKLALAYHFDIPANPSNKMAATLKAKIAHLTSLQEVTKPLHVLIDEYPKFPEDYAESLLSIYGPNYAVEESWDAVPGQALYTLLDRTPKDKLEKKPTPALVETTVQSDYDHCYNQCYDHKFATEEEFRAYASTKNVSQAEIDEIADMYRGHAECIWENKYAL